MNKLKELIKKIDRDIEIIKDDLREYCGNKEGLYFNKREKSIKLSHIFNWTQSFFPGMAVWAYIYTKDSKYLKWINGFYNEYYDKVFKTPLETMHDLGFLYSPYAVAMYKLTGDQNMKKIGVKAADELSKRFNPKGGYIRAWGRMDNEIPSYVDRELAKDHFFTESKGLAIIDCMMNIPLLYWASEVTGHPYYRRIADCHAETTIKYFIRDDYSVCHAYRFNEETGEPVGEANYCGYGIGSYWARGAAWAIYGFIIGYRYTYNKKYLDTSLKLAEAFIDQCGADAPVWDFRLPPGKEKAIDTSALAIALCGCCDIIKYTSSRKIREFIDNAYEILEKNTNYDQNINGMLKNINGQGIYASYGDYFLVEALSRKTSDFCLW